jgi:hypothetical protein
MLAIVLGGLFFYTSLHRLHGFLAPNAPEGRGVLVVEGWLDDESYDDVAALWQGGGYQQVVTTGGPIGQSFLEPFRTYAERAKARLKMRGVPDDAIAAVPASDTEDDRVVAGALEVRDWLARREPAVEALDVFSQGARARRIWAVYRKVLDGSIRVGVVSSAPRGYDAEGWWRSSSGARFVLGEAAGWAWVACCLGAEPAAPPATTAHVPAVPAASP